MNTHQLEFVADNAGSGQNAKILEYLKSHRNEWVAMTTLYWASGAFAIHSRAADLRRLGFNVENMVDRSTKPYKSFYRLQ